MSSSNNSISGIKNILYFEDKYIKFGKHNGKSFKWIYENDKKYCLWLSKNKRYHNDSVVYFIDFLKNNSHVSTLQYYIKFDDNDGMCINYFFDRFHNEFKEKKNFKNCSFDPFRVFKRNKKIINGENFNYYLKPIDMHYDDYYKYYTHLEFILTLKNKCDNETQYIFKFMDHNECYQDYFNYEFRVLFDRDCNQNYEWFSRYTNFSATFNKIMKLFRVIMKIYIEYKKNYEFIECKKLTKLIEKKYLYTYSSEKILSFLF